MMIKNILILGATGQIGKELSLEFKNSENLNIISHCRTLVSASFFNEKKIEYTVGKLEDKNMISKISDSDLIFDLSAPDHGSLKEIKYFYKKRFEFIFSHMKKNSKFVFASTMNAFGLNNNRKILKNYFFSSSIYASNKRYAEKYLINLGKKNLIKTYILRLGEVHGNFQRASTEIINLIKEKYVFEIPNTSAWITFIPIIKQSILNILNDKEEPGLYTLVCDDVYWYDLLNLIGKKINFKPKYIIMDQKNKFNRFFDFLYNIIISKKDLIRGNINLNNDFEDLMKLNFRVNKVKNSINKFKGVNIYSGKNIYVGVLPGKRLKSLKYNLNNIFN
jgi:nucleoside-diphosphate-sugar epimerase